MKKMNPSTILNIGSLATFIAFPVLHSASYGGSSSMLTLGGLLMVFSMIVPFIALKSQK